MLTKSMSFRVWTISEFQDISYADSRFGIIHGPDDRYYLVKLIYSESVLKSGFQIAKEWFPDSIISWIPKPEPPDSKP